MMEAEINVLLSSEELCMASQTRGLIFAACLFAPDWLAQKRGMVCAHHHYMHLQIRLESGNHPGTTLGLIAGKPTPGFGSDIRVGRPTDQRYHQNSGGLSVQKSVGSLVAP